MQFVYMCVLIFRFLLRSKFQRFLSRCSFCLQPASDARRVILYDKCRIHVPRHTDAESRALSPTRGEPLFDTPIDAAARLLGQVHCKYARLMARAADTKRSRWRALPDDADTPTPSRLSSGKDIYTPIPFPHGLGNRTSLLFILRDVAGSH